MKFFGKKRKMNFNLLMAFFIGQTTAGLVWHMPQVNKWDIKPYIYDPFISMDKFNEPTYGFDFNIKNSLLK